MELQEVNKIEQKTACRQCRGDLIQQDGHLICGTCGLPLSSLLEKTILASSKQTPHAWSIKEERKMPPKEELDRLAKEAMKQDPDVEIQIEDVAPMKAVETVQPRNPSSRRR
jgi:uncharacterized Zn finger protein (UPF0148 family)